MTSTLRWFLAGLCLLAAQPVVQAAWDLRGARPEIRHGALWVGGRPIYLVGVWVGGAVTTSPRLYKPDIDGDNIAYSRLLSAATAPLLGLNSAHPPMSPLRVARSTGWFTEDRHTQPRWDELQAFVKGLDGLPVTVDCAGIKAFESRNVPRELQQVNPGWHSFVPLCPERPQAWKIYQSYWQDCARQIVEAGSNAIIYEIFNEPAYNCRCTYNKRDFARRMALRYRTIGAANQIWHTSFGSFDDVAVMDSPEQTPGLWCDWIKFIGDRYAEILQAAKTAIMSVDPRRPLYFLDQPSISHTYLRCNGIDPVRVNAVMDIAGMEGGVSFGATRPRPEKDPMAAVLESKGRFSHQLYLDMARAFGRPVVNTETYCARFYSNVRFPSHAEDIRTELWEEMIHGASGSYFYNWGRRWWEWNDLAGAKHAAREIGYKAFSLLNPYAYPPASLSGFKDFLHDMDIVGDELLAGPRIQGQVALLISQPTLRQLFRGRSYTEKGPYEDTVREWYTALTLEQVPVDIIWEEQLPTAHLSRYKALLAPGMHNAYRATEKPLRRYVDQGGLLIATVGAFAQDEYGEPWRKEPADQGDGMQISARLLPEDLRGRKLQSELKRLLFASADFREFTLLPADDAGRPLTCEAYRIRRPSGDYYYLANWETISRLARLHVPSPVGRTVLSPLEHAVYAEGDPARDGVLLHLPSQTRTLVLVRKDSQATGTTLQPWTEQDVRARFREALEREQTELAAIETELAAARRAAEELQVSFGGPVTPAGEYQPDEKTVMLLHFNGTVDIPPVREAGPIAFVDGKFGTQALHLGPGAMLRFALPDNFDQDSGTLELWARPDWPTADGKRHTLVELKGPGNWNRNRLILYKNLNHEVAFALYDRTTKALAARVPINIFRQHQWTHLCATWDAQRGLEFYVNGQLRAAAKGPFEIERFDALTAGSTWSADRFWEGALEELRLSRGEREPAEAARTPR